MNDTMDAAQDILAAITDKDARALDLALQRYVTAALDMETDEAEPEPTTEETRY